MELTRLRRVLRQYEGAGYDDLRELLEAVDSVYEEAQDYEEALRRGERLDPDFLIQTVIAQSKLLVQVIGSLREVGAYEVLSVLVERFGYDHVQQLLGEWKARDDAWAEALADDPGDLDDHPF